MEEKHERVTPHGLGAMILQSAGALRFTVGRRGRFALCIVEVLSNCGPHFDCGEIASFHSRVGKVPTEDYDEENGLVTGDPRPPPPSRSGKRIDELKSGPMLHGNGLRAATCCGQIRLYNSKDHKYHRGGLPIQFVCKGV